MSLPRFGDLSSVSLLFRKPRVWLHLPTSTVEIDSVLLMLTELSAWHAGDPAPTADDWPPSDLDAYRRYTARAKARIGSYCVFAQSAAGMARDACRQIDDILDKLDEGGGKERAREREVARSPLLKNLRDHVFAHPASVADYKKEKHSPAYRATSLLYLGGEGGFHNREFVIGGVQHGGPLGPKDVPLPAVSMREIEAEAAACLHRWWSLLERRTQDLAARTDTELTRVIPGLAEVLRPERRN